MTSLRSLSFVALSALGAAFFPEPVSGQVDADGELLSRAAGFAVEIQGCPQSSRNIRQVDIDQTVIDIKETPAPGAAGRGYAPGATHWGQARITCATRPGGSKELQTWWQEAATGRNIRKNITVTLYRSDRSPGRSYVLMDCYPVRWEVGIDPENSEAVETVSVAPEMIVHVPGAGSSPAALWAGRDAARQDARVHGFQVQIDWGDGKEVDNAWETLSGGGVFINTSSDASRGEKLQTTSPGHKSVGEIVLRGAMTSKRAALCQWINDTTKGKSWRRSMSVTELLSGDGGTGRTVAFYDGFPVRYVYPFLSVHDTSGVHVDEIHLNMRRGPELPADAVGQVSIEGMSKTPVSGVALNDLDMDIALLSEAGDARNPSARLILPAGNSSELLDWYKQTADGKALPRQVRVEVSSPSDLSFSRTYILHDCLPTKHEASTTNSTGGPQSSGRGPVETLEVTVGRIELKAWP